MFIETPASKKSLSNRRLVHGVGVNDSHYFTHYTDKNNRRVFCPFYITWKSMLLRCYCPKRLNKFPTYKNCSVDKEWLIFSTFKKWMVSQDWKGKHLDKDLLIPGNKVYSQSACLFVNQDVNALLTDCGSRRGKYPTGVYFHKNYSNKKFSCKCSCFGKRIFLGYYKTSEDAHEVYKQFKSKHILEVAKEYKDEPRLYEALQNHARLMLLQSD